MQSQALIRGVEIVVATPGRLLDHIRQGTINLSAVEVFVLDEADRMFDMGFIKDVRSIAGELPVKRQTMLFSATISPEVRDLARSIQNSPREISVGRPGKAASGVAQRFYSVQTEGKLDLLARILGDEIVDGAIVFSRTKHGADRIARRLEAQGIAAQALHAGRTQSQREKALDGFRQGRFSVLVATDIAARGIDVDSVSHVFNYDVPTTGEDYVHRIGRTGRSTRTGHAITFMSHGEQDQVRRLERHLGNRVSVGQYSQGAGGNVPTRSSATASTVRPSEPSRRGDMRDERPDRYERTPRNSDRSASRPSERPHENRARRGGPSGGSRRTR
jgi:ATP-dependent RNA helicase RhlE